MRIPSDRLRLQVYGSRGGVGGRADVVGQVARDGVRCVGEAGRGPEELGCESLQQIRAVGPDNRKLLDAAVRGLKGNRPEMADDHISKQAQSKFKVPLAHA
jgi:hypothetical protein